MMPKEAGHLGVEILNGARRWARARAMLRRALDSKTATPNQLEQIKNAHNRAAHDLEVLVGRMERLLLLSGQVVPVNKRPPNPIPWQQLFGLLAKVGAEGLSGALNGQPLAQQPQQPQKPQQPPEVQNRRKDETIIDAEFTED